MRTDARNWFLTGLAALLVAPVLGQSPEGGDEGGPPADAGPGPAVFEPAPTADEEVIEEIIVYGRQDEWRLPDLGDSVRREREELERPRPGQVEFEFLPLYDPEQAGRDPDLFRMNDPLERVGKIELFRFRFGGD